MQRRGKVAPRPPPKRDTVATAGTAPKRESVNRFTSPVVGFFTKFASLGKYEKISWAFEILTAALSILDVVSDVLVARQFYVDGHIGWLWMVCVSLLVSNIIYTVMALDIILRERWNYTASTTPEIVTQFVLVFPFAQALPLVQWCYEARETWSKIGTTPEEGMSREDSWAIKTGGLGGASNAVREDLDEEDELRQLVHKFDKGFKQHLKAHAGFYVETLVEAAPQAVIQLLAVTALGQASGLQLLSMCLSLFSIVSKAYIVALSFDLRAMVFKAALVAFDVFSLFFVFSTLVAQNEAVETCVEFLVPSFLGLQAAPSKILGLAWVKLEVSWLAGVWLRFALTMLALAIVWFFGVCGAIAWEEVVQNRRRPTKENWFVPFLLLGGFCTIVFPALLAVQAAKASFILLILLSMMPRDGAAAFYALTFSFYRKGVRRGRLEEKARLHHLLHFTVNDSMKNMGERLRLQMIPSDPIMEILAERMHRLIDADKIRPWSYRRVRNEVPIVPTAGRKPFPRPKNWKDVGMGVVVVAGFLTFLFMVASAAFNLAFPFLHVWYYGVWHLNLLQMTCLAFAALSLLVIFALGPFIYHFVSFSYVLTDVLVVFGEALLDAASASQCIASYFTPPHVTVVKAAVKTETLPTEVVELLGAYLAPSDVDMSELTVEQCSMLKDRVR